MAGSKYEVVSQTVEVLLSPGTAQFEVPKFQRTYAWGPEEINQLVDDIFRDASKDDLPYFLGSIVLARRDDADTNAPELILDGQQRLTTISLIIAALIAILIKEGIDGVEENKMYLFSRKIKGIKKPKILLQNDDQKNYEILLNDPFKYIDYRYHHTPIGRALATVFQALDVSMRRLQKYDILGNIAEYMLGRVLYDLEIVRITAPSEKDAFRLFETLNDRGLALSAADLIKNKLFSHCGSEIDDAFDAWTNMVSLTKDDDVVNFLRYFWIAFKGFARKRGLYDVYKDHINMLDTTSAALFAFDLDEAAKDYHQIINPNSKTCTWGVDVAEGLERLNSYRARSYRPVILACSKFRKSDVPKIVALCESITIRYSVVGEKNPNQLEDIYAALCAMLRDKSFSLIDIAATSLLSEVPIDTDFQQKFASMEVHTINNAWREILIQLNTALGTGETRVQNANRVHVEHILPQSPRALVLSEAGLSIEDATMLTPRIGNLTLLSGKKNRELSNKPFSAKRDVYRTSEISMTRSLTIYQRWGMNEIQDRCQELAQLAVKVYPHPNDLLRS